MGADAVDETLKLIAPDASAEVGPDDDLPPGKHALEVAARRGYGPLSPLAKKVWHGNAAPCVTCGQLVTRGALQCDHCSQDLRPEMIGKMRNHSGPWFVLEHLRPFPGVSLDRVIRQIRRGLITETSIVRGPATDFQWCFAVETPGLCRYFGKCWHCHHAVAPADTYCSACLSHLSFEKPHPASHEPRASTSEPRALARADLPMNAAPPLGGGAIPGQGLKNAAPPTPNSLELQKLAGVVRSLETLPAAANLESAARLGPFRVSWIIVGAMVITLIALLAIVQLRSSASAFTTH